MWQSRGGGKRKQVQCKISRGCPLVPQQCSGDGGGEGACKGHRKDSDSSFPLLQNMELTAFNSALHDKNV